jgi:hypothetical protein
MCRLDWSGKWACWGCLGDVVGGCVGIGCPLGLIWLQKHKKYGFLVWPDVVKSTDHGTLRDHNSRMLLAGYRVSVWCEDGV